MKNPEQWPEGVWLEDARLMQEAGVNIVSLGVFAWSSIEPTTGRYEFDWLDRVMAILHDHGISVALATPTASPPPWLVRQHPDVLPVTAHGATLWHGSRRHYCPHSPSYREAAARIARVLAERYGEHPALAAWHVDNEYACHVSECFCHRSIASFRAWLRHRYQSVDELNRAWGTAFWGQRYSDFDEVGPPRPTPTFVNPSQLLDWRRFWSDSWLACYRDQAALLRELTPSVPVTTNFMGFHEPLDYWTWALEEDFVSHDSYPDPADPEWMIETAMTFDLMAGLRDGRPWLLTEQAPAHVSWRDHNATKPPGMVRLGSLQALAHGADGIMFFQWRASRYGAERHHSAMVSHVGPSNRTWREIVELGADLARCREILGSRPAADVAILFDWENVWALSSGGHPSRALHHPALVRAFYRVLFAGQRSVRFAHPERDLSTYKLAIAPSLYLLSEAGAENLARFVEAGGALVVTFWTGVADHHDHVHPGGLVAPLRQLLGLVVEEIAPQPAGRSRRIETLDGASFSSHLWAEKLRLEGAVQLAGYADGGHPDGPAIVHNRFGRGHVFYTGTMPDDHGLACLLGRAADAAGLDRAVYPHGLEVTRRIGDEIEWLFLLNHGDETVVVSLRRPADDILSGRRHDLSVAVAPMDAVILRLPR